MYMRRYMYVIQYLTALIKNDFSGSKELKDKLISSPILQLWLSGSRMMYNKCSASQKNEILEKGRITQFRQVDTVKGC